jgi:SRSO17 transposase
MSKRSGESSEARFSAYVEALTAVFGHAGRAAPLRDSCTGLLRPAAQKCVEPMAALIVLARAREIVFPEITRGANRGASPGFRPAWTRAPAS